MHDIQFGEKNIGRRNWLFHEPLVLAQPRAWFWELEAHAPPREAVRLRRGWALRNLDRVGGGFARSVLSSLRRETFLASFFFLGSQRGVFLVWDVWVSPFLFGRLAVPVLPCYVFLSCPGAGCVICASCSLLQVAWWVPPRRGRWCR